jgi:hypothetical protein
MRDMKPLPDRDPARATLAAAIAPEAGARRDLQVASNAAGLAERRHWDAQSKLDELRKVVAAPSGALADSFIASVGAGNPCETAVLERSAVDARAKMTAAENEVAVWDETRRECDVAVRAKEAEVSNAKERVEKAARVVVANSEMVTRLVDSLEAMQAEVIARRVALRFIWGKGLNGELSGPDKARIESLLRQDLTGWESHPVHGVWRAAFEELQSNPEAELPS